ncbi:hypothetical protein R3P38DRAFT_2794030 [Favolaschia claudopus]|uniref:Uncharacterized protein n=1 Tax=Favolaschia claudopus TaxID=2862362 RepID=A0AAW0ABA5_9AGAR
MGGGRKRAQDLASRRWRVKGEEGGGGKERMVDLVLLKDSRGCLRTRSKPRERESIQAAATELGLGDNVVLKFKLQASDELPQLSHQQSNTVFKETDLEVIRQGQRKSEASRKRGSPKAHRAWAESLQRNEVRGADENGVDGIIDIESEIGNSEHCLSPPPSSIPAAPSSGLWGSSLYLPRSTTSADTSVCAHFEKTGSGLAVPQPSDSGISQSIFNEYAWRRGRFWSDWSCVVTGRIPVPRRLPQFPFLPIEWRGLPKFSRRSVDPAECAEDLVILIALEGRGKAIKFCALSFTMYFYCDSFNRASVSNSLEYLKAVLAIHLVTSRDAHLDCLAAKIDLNNERWLAFVEVRLSSFVQTPNLGLLSTVCPSCLGWVNLVQAARTFRLEHRNYAGFVSGQTYTRLNRARVRFMVYRNYADAATLPLCIQSPVYFVLTPKLCYYRRSPRYTFICSIDSTFSLSSMNIDNTYFKFTGFSTRSTRFVTRLLRLWALHLQFKSECTLHNSSLQKHARAELHLNTVRYARDLGSASSRFKFPTSRSSPPFPAANARADARFPREFWGAAVTISAFVGAEQGGDIGGGVASILPAPACEAASVCVSGRGRTHLLTCVLGIFLAVRARRRRRERGLEFGAQARAVAELGRGAERGSVTDLHSPPPHKRLLADACLQNPSPWHCASLSAWIATGAGRVVGDDLALTRAEVELGWVERWASIAAGFGGMELAGGRATSGRQCRRRWCCFCVSINAPNGRDDFGEGVGVGIEWSRVARALSAGVIGKERGGGGDWLKWGGALLLRVDVGYAKECGNDGGASRPGEGVFARRDVVSGRREQWAATLMAPSLSEDKKKTNNAPQPSERSLAGSLKHVGENGVAGVVGDIEKLCLCLHHQHTQTPQLSHNVRCRKYARGAFISESTCTARYKRGSILKEMKSESPLALRRTVTNSDRRKVNAPAMDATPTRDPQKRRDRSGVEKPVHP